MKVLFATSRAAMLEAWSNRRSFWLQVTIMVANDLALVAFWLVFFSRVGSVRGWDQSKVLLLYAILAVVSGLTFGLFHNTRRIGEIVSSGELDSILALPVEPLPYLLVRRVNTAILGDLAFGPLLFVVACHPTPERTGLFLLGSLCGTTVMISFLVMLGSLALVTGGRGEAADLGFNAVLIVASYPLDLFGGALKLVMFTLVPAAFITGLPTELVDSFDPLTAAGLAGAAIAFAGAAWLLFEAGLRGYRSGARWTRA
jgi:ABC-2 type transport system permease protein